MSEQRTYRIACPRCRQEQSVALYESLNVQTSPDLKGRFLANALNLVTCPECGLSFRVDKPLLYHDPARNVMIYLVPLGDAAVEAGARQFTDALRQVNGLLPADIHAPSVTLVFNRAELVERIFLLEAGLNERVIEYLKYLIYTRNAPRLDPAKKALLFDAEDSTDQVLCFVVQDLKSYKLEAVLHYDRTAYTALCEMFDRDEQTPRLLELFPGPHVSARALLLRESKGTAPAASPPPAPE